MPFPTAFQVLAAPCFYAISPPLSSGPVTVTPTFSISLGYSGSPISVFLHLVILAVLTHTFRAYADSFQCVLVTMDGCVLRCSAHTLSEKPSHRALLNWDLLTEPSSSQPSQEASCLVPAAKADASRLWQIQCQVGFFQEQMWELYFKGGSIYFPKMLCARFTALVLCVPSGGRYHSWAFRLLPNPVVFDAS